MGRAYSLDLRERVVGSVRRGGLSCHQAAAQFGVAVSTAINWVRRFRETGSVEPDQIGGYRPKKIAGAAPRLAGATVPEGGFHLTWAGGRTRRAWPEGRLSHGVGVRPRREAQS